jgi:septal ring factor EnvC (AmiA/AmiB activator)
MQFNPSFAGQVGGPRISSIIGYGLNNYSSGRSHGTAVHTSYDQFVPAIRSGVGITADYSNGYGKFDFFSQPLSYLSFSAQRASVNVVIAPKF